MSRRKERKKAASLRHPIWDTYLAPGISQIEQRQLKSVPRNIWPDPLQFVITSILLPQISLTTRVRTFNFIRRSRIVLDEYQLARRSYRKFFIDRDPAHYLAALHHFEVCISSAHQGHEALFGIGGSDFRNAKAQGRGELNWRMNRIYVSSKHAADFVRRASFKGDVLTVWISSRGIETQHEHMTFSELYDILIDMCLTASIMAKSYIWRRKPVPPFWLKSSQRKAYRERGRTELEI